MEEKVLNISDEVLQNLSIDEIADLKVEVDDLLSELDNVVDTCDAALNY